MGLTEIQRVFDVAKTIDSVLDKRGIIFLTFTRGSATLYCISLCSPVVCHHLIPLTHSRKKKYLVYGNPTDPQFGCWDVCH